MEFSDYTVSVLRIIDAITRSDYFAIVIIWIAPTHDAGQLTSVAFGFQ